MPQPSSADSCPNYCHSESLRKTHQIAVLDELATELSNVRKPLVASQTPVLNGPDTTYLSRTDPRRRPWSNIDPYSDRYAAGAGSTFDALRITNLESGESEAVVLQWESQRFSTASTEWESRHSPLIKHRISSLVPVVDPDGYVVGYAGRTKAERLWRASDGSIVFLPWVSGTSAGTRVEAAALRQIGFESLNGRDYGGDYAEIFVDIDGCVLGYQYATRPTEPPDFWPSLILSLAGNLIYGLTKAAIRTVINTGLRKISNTTVKNVARRIGFYTGTAERVSLFHGTTHTGRLAIEADGIVVRAGSGIADDFGDGFYMTMDSQVAQQRSAVSTFAKATGEQPVTTAVLQVDIEMRQLGKIVDIRPGGKHRELWEAFLDEPVGAGTTMGWVFETGQDRGKWFGEFLKRHGLQDADTIIGPLGDKFTTGAAALRSGAVSNQVVLRSQTVLDRVSKIIKQ